MLVLGRKEGESIRIGDEIVVTVVSCSSGQVRIGIDAPARVAVHREEIYDSVAAANRQAASGALPIPDLGPQSEPKISQENPE